MTLNELYSGIEGNFIEVKNRLMTERLVGKMVLKYPGDPSMQQLLDAVTVGDNEAAFRAVHTLKGVSANLSFTRLNALASALTEQLRPLTQPADLALLHELEECHNQHIALIAQYEAQLD